MSYMSYKSKTPMIDEYFDIYNEKVKEYGEKTCVLMMNGSFYENFSIDNEIEKIGNTYELSKLLNMVYANKKGNLKENNRSYPNFIGFNTGVLQKYLPILLENDYTVVIVDQLESSQNKKGKLIKRGITAIYSKCLQPLNFDNESTNYYNLVYITIQIEPSKKSSTKRNAILIQQLNISVVCVNNFTNNIQLTERKITFLPGKIENCLNDLDNLLYKYFAKEIHVNILDNESANANNSHDIYKYFNNNYENLKFKILNESEYKDYFVENYQNEYLKKVYKHVNFGLVQPVQYFHLEKYTLSIFNFMLVLDYISKHDHKYITNLSIPQIINDTDYLLLELNTYSQLNIDAVFDIINYTKTSIGKRYLKSLLCKPMKNPLDINMMYNLTDELEHFSLQNGDIYNKCDKLLTSITDFEKLHRKMALDMLHPYEFEKLHTSYNTIITITQLLKSKQTYLNNILPNDDIMVQLHKYIEMYTKTFDLDKMKCYNLNTTQNEISNYFHKGVIHELDIIQKQIEDFEIQIEEQRLNYNSKFDSSKNDKNEFIKLNYSDMEGYSFICTNIRYQTLLQKMKTEKDESYTQFKIKQTNNVVKFYTNELVKLSNNLVNNRELLNNKINLHYLNTMKGYYNDNHYIFNQLKIFIEKLDVINSNYICKVKNNYTRPIIRDNDSDNNDSFLEAVEIRHPIVEKLAESTYITNDITLNKSSSGMLLYGLNSCGKSTTLRAIGVCVILAQAGLFVPCKSFTYSPFHTLISQVDSHDDMNKGVSSFINECIGIKKILQCSGKNTLCIADELTKGTEQNSGTSILASIIIELIKNNTKFFFTSHLHDVPNIPDIKQQHQLQICHLSVNIQNDNIIFERKIKPGSGPTLYGLEVCSNILKDYDQFVDTAFKIRNQLTNNNTKILSNKKSRYNKKKILDNCQICNSQNNLETHHIEFQSNCDEKGFVKNKHFHKNELFNLVCLCKICHDKITFGKIICTGYKDSLNGTYLDWCDV